MDGSDELPHRPCSSSKLNIFIKYSKSDFCLDVGDPLNNLNNELNNRVTPSKRQHWRGVVIAAFLLIILIVFILFVGYFIFRRFIHPQVPLMNGERKNYATILNSRTHKKVSWQKIFFSLFLAKNRSETTATKVVIQNDRTGKHLDDDDYNLL